MNHEEHQEQVSALIDDELEEKYENDLFLHLTSCSQCRDFLKESLRLYIEISSKKPRDMEYHASYNPEHRGTHISGRNVVPTALSEKRGIRSFLTAGFILVLALSTGLFFSAVTLIMPVDDQSFKEIQYEIYPQSYGGKVLR
ncbi:MAG: hypothetical protein V1799_01785 [bacterium]